MPRTDAWWQVPATCSVSGQNPPATWYPAVEADRRRMWVATIARWTRREVRRGR